MAAILHRTISQKFLGCDRDAREKHKVGIRGKCDNSIERSARFSVEIRMQRLSRERLRLCARVCMCVRVSLRVAPDDPKIVFVHAGRVQGEG